MAHTTRMRRVLAVLAISSLVVAACGGDDDAADPATQTDPSPTDAPSATGTPAATDAPDATDAPRPVATVRFASIETSGQSALPKVMADSGIGAEHGLDIEIVPYAQPGGQYNMIGSDADVVAGNILDLHRRRAAGTDIVAVWGFKRFANPIVALPDSDIESFGDLKGRKVGQFGTTFLDWLVVRTAGAITYGFDIEEDSEIIQAAPPLLIESLNKGEVDATLQFDSLALAPVTRGEQRVVTDAGQLVAEAGYDPDSMYLVWMISQEWIDDNPGALDDLQAAFAETYDVLRTDDSVWPELAALAGVSDDLLEAYRENERRTISPPFHSGLLQSTQELVDAMIDIVGTDAVGLETLDPDAFAFPDE